MPQEHEGFLRNRRWPRPIPDYGTDGLAGMPLTPAHIERIAQSVGQVNDIMLELIELARKLRAHGHDAVAYQVESLSMDLETAIEWEMVTGDVVTPDERVAHMVNNTWSG